MFLKSFNLKATKVSQEFGRVLFKKGQNSYINEQ